MPVPAVRCNVLGVGHRDTDAGATAGGVQGKKAAEAERLVLVTPQRSSATPMLS